MILSFIPYPPSIYNLDYDPVKELSNRIYIQCEEFWKNLDYLHDLRTTIKNFTKDIKNLVSLKYLCEYENTLKEMLRLFRMPKLFPSVGTTKLVEHCNTAKVHRSSPQGVVF